MYIPTFTALISSVTFLQNGLTEWARIFKKNSSIQDGSLENLSSNRQAFRKNLQKKLWGVYSELS